MVDHSQSLVVALRGFKVRPETLDKFLATNGDVHGTENGRYPPFYKYDTSGAASEKMSDILRAMLAVMGDSNDNSGTLVVVPALYPHDRSPWVYVAYTHTFIYSQKLIPDNDLHMEVPRGFEQLRQEILACTSSSGSSDEGLVGFYIIKIGDRLGPIPVELQERHKDIIHCGMCEETFDQWTKRQWHRYTVHKLDEDIDALPENA